MNIRRRRGILRWRHVWQGLLCLPGKIHGSYSLSGNLCSSGLPEEKKGQYLLAGFAILLTAALTVKAVDVMYEYRSDIPVTLAFRAFSGLRWDYRRRMAWPGCTIAISKPRLQNMIFNRSLPHRKERNIFANDWMEFTGESGYGQRFLLKKLEDQWIEPLFSSLKATESFDTDGEPLSSGIRVCTMGTYMKPYGSWPIITRVSYTWQDLYLELLCAEDGGKKRNSDSIVAAVDWHIRWLPVQYHLGSAEQICISVLCIFDPLCADGTL